jgi:hypothetical protein
MISRDRVMMLDWAKVIGLDGPGFGEDLANIIILLPGDFSIFLANK